MLINNWILILSYIVIIKNNFNTLLIIVNYLGLIIKILYWIVIVLDNLIKNYLIQIN